MAIHTTYSNARANLAQLLNEITANHEIIIVARRGKENVAMIEASELASLMETAHLLRSPRNAQRLLTALDRARTDEEKPMTIENLRTEVGIEE